MTVSMGPALGLRSCTADTWSVSVLLVIKGEAPGALGWRFAETEAVTEVVATPLLAGPMGMQASRFVVDVPRTQQEQVIEFDCHGATGSFVVPAQGQSPQMAYGSCNGFSSQKLMKGIDDKNAMWTAMGASHDLVGYHLLLLGGDQVYSDSMWETVPSLRDWNELSFKKGNARAFTEEMRRQTEQFFFKLYVERWSQPEVAALLASVPMVAMWDDHDLLDGWGSYPEERQRCPVFQGIGAIATTMFRTFQLHLSEGERHPSSLSTRGLTNGFVVGGVCILALDMRSERGLTQVLGPEHWNDVYAFLEQPADIDHLIVMSSIPVVYPGFDTLERLLGFIPGQQELEDDLRDHWTSRQHKGERLRFIHRLLELADAQRVRPIIVSGDVHVAAIGVIEAERFGSGGDRQVIHQLISSGIVHPAPPKAVVFALRHLFDSNDELEPGIVARMTEFPNHPTKFIGKRNFLSLEPDRHLAQRRIWANWYFEGDDAPVVKVILPMPTMASALP